MTEFGSSYDPGVQVDSDDMLSLHRNENLFVGRDWTVDAAQQLVEHAHISSYPEATSKDLREAIAELYGVGAENVFVRNGADEVLSDLLGILRPRFQRVSTLEVCFKVYNMLAERMGFQQDTLPGHSFETGRIEAPEFRGLALVDSPNAISGSSIVRDDLFALAADQQDSFLIWDNVYGEYADETLPPALPKNVALVRSFSKFYGLAGLRIGYCIADAELVGAMMACKDAFNVNSLGQVMAVEALRRRDHFLGLRQQLVTGRRALVDGLEGFGFQVLPSDSVAVLAKHPEHTAEFLQAQLLERRVAVRRFADPLTADWIRITAAPQPVLDRFLAALHDFLG